MFKSINALISQNKAGHGQNSLSSGYGQSSPVSSVWRCHAQAKTWWHAPVGVCFGTVAEKLARKEDGEG